MFLFHKAGFIIRKKCNHYQQHATSQQTSQSGDTSFCVSQCPRASLSQLPQRRRQRRWCLSPAAPRHVVYSISSPHLWYLNHKGERFISLLGEEGWSCLSERTCWIRGVISPEGGYESECHSQSTQSRSPSARCQGARLWLFPSSSPSSCFSSPHRPFFLSSSTSS